MSQSHDPTLTSFSASRRRSLFSSACEGPDGGGASTMRSSAQATTARRKSHCSGLGSPASPISTVSAPMPRSLPNRGTAARPVPGQTASAGSAGGLPGPAGPAGDTVVGRGTHTPLPRCRARAGASGPSWSTISQAWVRASGRPADDTMRSMDMGPRRWIVPPRAPSSPSACCSANRKMSLSVTPGATVRSRASRAFMVETLSSTFRPKPVPRRILTPRRRTRHPSLNGAATGTSSFRLPTASQRCTRVAYRTGVPARFPLG